MVNNTLQRNSITESDMEMSRDVPLCYRTLHPWRTQGKEEFRGAEQTLRQETSSPLKSQYK